MSETIAGITIPDSKMAVEVTDLVRDVSTELVYHHCRRVFLFGALRGQRDGVAYDPELLYVAAMMHDLGLTEKYRTSDQRFEIDAADEARDFLRGHGVPEAEAQKIWEAIALHTTPEIPLHMAAEIALLTRGVEDDVMGVGFDTVDEDTRALVTAAHPRPNFKEGIIQAFAGGLRHRPETTFGNVKADVLADTVPGFERGDFVAVIRGSQWPE